MSPCLICGGEVRLDNPEAVAAAAADELALKKHKIELQEWKKEVRMILLTC